LSRKTSKGFRFQGCKIVVDRTEVAFDNKYVNVSVEIATDELTGSVGNMTVVNFNSTFDKVLVYLKVSFPLNDQDKNYQREFLKTTIDAERLFQGVTGNFVAKSLSENLLKSLDFEPKFPLKPVRKLTLR